MTPRSLALSIAMSAWFASVQPVAHAQSCEPFEVLVFSKTAGFRHEEQIVAGAALVQAFGAAHGFGVEHSEDAALIEPANLARYAVVIFLHTTGDILDSAQEAALEGYVLGGGGFVGVHSAADTEHGWPFYGTLVGAYFFDHPAIQPAEVSVVDPNHPSTASLPALFSHTDEWYDYQTNVAANPAVDVLLTVDESTYTGGNMGPVHPIAWCQDLAGGGRSWYTGMGHTLASYSAPFFQEHLLGGILWAADSIRTSQICAASVYGIPSGSPLLSLRGVQVSPTLGALVLSGGNPGGAGILCLSSCPASVLDGSLSILVELDPPGFVLCSPLVFDSAGKWRGTLPLTLELPGSLGNSLFFQGAQLTPSLGLSNGLELDLCP